jgi:hypothetical protein
MRGLREYIRLLLEEEVLGEPDMSAEEERDEEESHHDEQSGVAAAGIAGETTPLGTGPAYPSTDRRKRKMTTGLPLDRKKNKKQH